MVEIMKIEQSTLDVLGNARIEDNKLFLVGQLARHDYMSVNKVLEAAGGKWNRKEKAHIFEEDIDVSNIINEIIETGEVISAKSEFGFFETPEEVVEYILSEFAMIKSGMSVLEPSAGRGAIAFVCAKMGAVVDCCELLPKNADHLKNMKVLTGGRLVRNVWCSNFLEEKPRVVYDRVVMNPPFAKQQDIHHVLHAYKFVKPGGILVSIMAAGVNFRSNKLTKDFREFVDGKGGSINPLPEGCFKESGTMVRSVVAVIPKPKGIKLLK